MAKNFRNYDKEEKSGEIKKLKGIIKKLEHEITRLKSELRTYDRAFQKNIEFLKKGTDELSLEDLLNGAKNELNLKEIKEDKKYTMAELTAKWKCFKCPEGVLKLIIVPNNRYFRKCTCCEHRTEVQDMTDEVEGLK